MDTLSLSHHFLIAMPNLHSDSFFARTVVYVCEHSERGAMGVIVNRPSEMTLQSLFDQVELHLGRTDLAQLPVYFGGPVQANRGFVLHQPVGEWQSTLAVTDSTALTTSRDILSAIEEGGGPERMLVTLGYAGWEAGQLEHELSENAWLTVAAPDALDLVFELPPAHRYDAALRLLGVDVLSLSAQAGHA